MSSEVNATGRCLCGAISYAIKGEPTIMALCHCRACQQASGAGHISVAFFAADQVEIKGETTGHVSTADSGNILTRHFCPSCGGRIFNMNSARPGVVGIMVGSVDDSSWFSPQAVVYTKDRSSWDKTPTDIPNFEAMPPMPK